MHLGVTHLTQLIIYYRCWPIEIHNECSALFKDTDLGFIGITLKTHTATTEEKKHTQCCRGNN